MNDKNDTSKHDNNDDEHTNATTMSNTQPHEYNRIYRHHDREEKEKVHKIISTAMNENGKSKKDTTQLWK